jgi:hypothetical protein
MKLTVVVFALMLALVCFSFFTGDVEAGRGWCHGC